MKIRNFRRGDTLVTIIEVDLPRIYSKGQLKYDKQVVGQSTALWPRILSAMARERAPMTAADIARHISADPRSVYASMASLGASGGRHYIAPVNRWGRKEPFVITGRGLDIVAAC